MMFFGVRGKRIQNNRAYYKPRNCIKPERNDGIYFIITMVNKSHIQNQEDNFSPALYGLLSLLLILYIAFLTYVSIIELDQVHTSSRPFPLGLLLDWRQHTYMFDIYQNLLLYLPLGLLSFFVFKGFKLSNTSCLFLSLLLAFLLCTTLECAQSFIPSRFSSLMDIITNTFSGFLGALFGLYFWFTQTFWKRQISKSVKTEFQCPFFAGTCALAIMIWAGTQLFPFVPTLHPKFLKLGLAPLNSVLNHSEAFDFDLFKNYALQGVVLFIAGVVLLKPNRRFLLLVSFISIVLLLKITIISRALSMEAVVGLLSSLFVLESILLVWTAITLLFKSASSGYPIR